MSEEVYIHNHIRRSLNEISKHNRKRAAFLALKHEQLHFGRLSQHEKAMLEIRLYNAGSKLVEQEYQKFYAPLEERALELLQAEFDEKVIGEQARKNRKRFLRLLDDELEKYGSFYNLPDEWRAKYRAFSLAVTQERNRDYRKQCKDYIWEKLRFSFGFTLREKLFKNFGIKRKNAINPNWWEILKQEIEL